MSECPLGEAPEELGGQTSGHCWTPELGRQMPGGVALRRNTACFPTQLGFLFKTVTAAKYRRKQVSFLTAHVLETQKWGKMRDVTVGKQHSWALKKNSLQLLSSRVAVSCYLRFSSLNREISVYFKRDRKVTVRRSLYRGSPKKQEVPGYSVTLMTSFIILGFHFPLRKMRRGELGGFQTLFGLDILSFSECLSGSPHSKYADMDEQEWGVQGPHKFSISSQSRPCSP